MNKLAKVGFVAAVAGAAVWYGATPAPLTPEQEAHNDAIVRKELYETLKDTPTHTLFRLKDREGTYKQDYVVMGTKDSYYICVDDLMQDGSFEIIDSYHKNRLVGSPTDALVEAILRRDCDKARNEALEHSASDKVLI